MVIFLSPWITADAEGGLKIRAQLRPDLQGFGDDSHQQASAGYIPAHCLPLPKTYRPALFFPLHCSGSWAILLPQQMIVGVAQ